MNDKSLWSNPQLILRTQPCPVCKTPMGDMPGSRDAYCPECGYKDPCCE